MPLNKRLLVIIAFILIAVLFRLVPHLPNVTPITAAALFSGVYFKDKRYAFAIPLAAMLLSDIVIGFYWISIFVYIAFALVSLIGIVFKKMNIKTVLLSSISFFIITNLGVWLLSYPKTLQGLTECYTLAIPFFRYSLIGDLFYSAILYFGFEFVSKKYLKLA